MFATSEKQALKFISSVDATLIIFLEYNTDVCVCVCVRVVCIKILKSMLNQRVCNSRIRNLYCGKNIKGKDFATRMLNAVSYMTEKF